LPAIGGATAVVASFSNRFNEYGSFDRGGAAVCRRCAASARNSLCLAASATRHLVFTEHTDAAIDY
jgi:hypothetical protein